MVTNSKLFHQIAQVNIRNRKTRFIYPRRNKKIRSPYLMLISIKMFRSHPRRVVLTHDLIKSSPPTLWNATRQKIVIVALIYLCDSSSSSNRSKIPPFDFLRDKNQPQLDKQKICERLLNISIKSDFEIPVMMMSSLPIRTQQS